MRPLAAPAALRLPAAALLAGALPGLACLSTQRRAGPPPAVVGGDPVVQMKAPGKLRSLESPALVPLETHSYPPGGNEPLVGTDVGGRGRAYPIGLLNTYEVVNDQSDFVSYVVARCALTEITALYDRRVNGRTLTFVNSGALWRDTLVLQDRETGTLWTAATGRALSGPLEGETLRAMPARVTTVGAWRTAYPSSLYLDTGELSSVGLPMQLYGLSPWQGVSGFETLNRRYKPKQEVFAVVVEGETLAFTAAELSPLGHTSVTLAGRPVELRWDPAFSAPRAFTCDEELAVTPMYWFALDRHFAAVRTLAESTTP